MIRSLVFAVAVGSAALLSSASAGALPVGPASAPAVAAAESDVQLVRDGCGYGYRYSNRRGGCVPDYDRGPPPPPRYVAPPPRYYAPAPAVVLPVPVPRVVVPACPPGQRYSNSRRMCVWR